MFSIRKMVVPVMGAVLLTACQDNVTGPVVSAAPKGVSAPGTVVTAAATTTSEATFEIRQSGPGINDEGNNVGTCGAAGRWTNPSGNTSSTVPHPNCLTLVLGGPVVITFGEVANYVQSTNGNLQLNFSRYPDPILGDPRGVQYKKNNDATEGFGILYGTGDDDSVWQIDLAQFIVPGSAGLDALTRSLAGQTCLVSDPTVCAAFVMSW